MAHNNGSEKKGTYKVAVSMQKGQKINTACRIFDETLKAAGYSSNLFASREEAEEALDAMETVLESNRVRNCVLTIQFRDADWVPNW